MTLVRLFIYCLVLVPMSGSNVSNVSDKSMRQSIDLREQVSFTGTLSNSSSPSAANTQIAVTSRPPASPDPGNNRCKVFLPHFAFHTAQTQPVSYSLTMLGAPDAPCEHGMLTRCSDDNCTTQAARTPASGCSAETQNVVPLQGCLERWRKWLAHSVFKTIARLQKKSLLRTSEG